MHRPPFRRLLARGAVGPERIFHHNLWYRGHTNRRYAELIPRLARVDAYLIFLPQQRVIRGVGYRLLGRSLGVRRPIVRAGARRYRTMFATELEQIAHFPGPIVADVDDPVFDAREVELLARPNVVAYVVTADLAARRFAALGIEKPVHVVPQGVSLAALDPRAVAAVAQCRRDGEAVVGYVSALLLLDGDRGGGTRCTTSSTCSSSGRRSAPASPPACGWSGGRAAVSGGGWPAVTSSCSASAVRACPRPRGELRRRALPAHARRGRPRCKDRRLPGRGRSERLLRLRGHERPPRNRSQDCSHARRESLSTRSCAWRPTPTSAGGSRRPRGRPGTNGTGNRLREYDAILDRHLPPDTLLR